ncbi:hypothetical protein [Nannocystis sp. SCPEA4]|uniref:hypothetical protein n=1 Tax=Nannocystis sp. SCPEA4 TaxID=2996787 RepID=UPI00226DBA59|nr:hypothetical protein [Nannocystis sp. SCPEA4]MCY1061418.1 hypothetical protein [Nannocystis sp. SCPEA4]
MLSVLALRGLPGDRHRLIAEALGGTREQAAATLLSPLIVMAQAGPPTPPPADKWGELLDVPPAPRDPPPAPAGRQRPPGLVGVLALLGLGALILLVVRMVGPDGSERAEPSPGEAAAPESVESAPAGETPPPESSPSKASEPGSAESGSGKSGSSESGKSASGQSESGKSESGKSESGQSEAEKSGSGKSEAEKSESEKSGSGQSESGRSGSEKSGSGNAESTKPSSAGSDSAQTSEADRQNGSGGKAEPAAQKDPSERAPADKGSSESSPAEAEAPPPAMPDPPTEPEHLFRPHRDKIAKQCKKPHGLSSALVVLRVTVEGTRIASAEPTSTEAGARQQAASCIEKYIRTQVKVPTTYTGARNFSYAF